VTYFITFACYGCRVHGDDRGSVDRLHNKFATPILETDVERQKTEFSNMEQYPYSMDDPRRTVVLHAIQEVCSHRDWYLHAVHVRSNHVHVIVAAEPAPELVMNSFKSWASRRLNEAGFDSPARKRWARHGSTRWLWEPENIAAAMAYVVGEQGEPMSIYEESER
jgi:REP element-mobilizing transposase RayT